MSREENEAEKETLRSQIFLYLKGIAMGGADIIPGVSGGTIALITGIYDRFISALSSIKARHIVSLLKAILFFNKEKQKQGIEELKQIPSKFLLVLVAGITSGLLGMSFIIPGLMQNYPFAIFSIFFGLIAFSITIPYRMMNHSIASHVLILAFGIGTFFLVGLSKVSSAQVKITSSDTQESFLKRADQKGGFAFTDEDVEKLPNQFNLTYFSKDKEKLGEAKIEKQEEKLNVIANSFKDFELIVKKSKKNSYAFKIILSQLPNQALWFIALSGALAICAMILPGISGAYILVMLGQYTFTLHSLKRALKGSTEDLKVVAVFVAGILAGILTFVRIFKYLLKNYHSQTMAALTGIITGSLRALWPFSNADVDYEVTSLFTFCGLVITGAAVVFLLEKLSNLDASEESS